MVTESPGPKSLSHFNELMAVQECSSVHFFCDYSSSYGNYVVDADGNRLLDVFSQIGELLTPFSNILQQLSKRPYTTSKRAASLPLGYNHPSITSALSSPEARVILANRYDISSGRRRGWE